MIVYHIPERNAARATAVIEQDLPRWALSWTPPLERCLAPGETYAWRVGAALGETESAWSEPAWFAVAGTELVFTPRLVDEVVRQLAVRTAAEAAGAAEAQGTRPIRGRGPLPAGSESIPTEGLGASVFSVGNGGAVTAGAVTADSFTGDGSGLSSLAAASLIGTVAVANGGTGADTAAGARTNLDAAATTHTHAASGVTGLTSGRVLFGDSSGTIGEDGALFWDNTNKRLGLGTAAPNQQLELTGNLRMPVTAATSGTATAGVLFLGPDRFLHDYAGAGTAGRNTFLGVGAATSRWGVATSSRRATTPPRAIRASPPTRRVTTTPRAVVGACTPTRRATAIPLSGVGVSPPT